MSEERRIEMLVIGDELLDGRVTDSNSVKIAARLAELGASLAQRTTVTDDIDAIVREARAAIARGTDLCLVSGGLGPTSDDVTAEALAVLAGVSLERDESQVAAIEKRLRWRGRPMTENQKKQADRPAGAELIPNPRGTAPGFALEIEGCRFVAMPGVPRELEHMMEVAVFDGLTPTANRVLTRTLYTFGLVEAEVDDRLGDLRERFGAVRVGFRAWLPEIHVSLKAPATFRATLDEAVAAARTALGDAVFTDEEGVSFAAAVLGALRQRGATLATAESCTGGLMGDRLTDVPGSSDVYLGGVVSYSNAVKELALGVSAATLAAHGAVSEPTVLEMARGVRERFGATFGVAASGVAGPGGGTPDRPVGTIWMAAVGDDLEKTRLLRLPFDRRGNKVVSAHAALDLLRRNL